LGIGPNPPNPNPQSPIPNPQRSFFSALNNFNRITYICLYIYYIIKMNSDVMCYIKDLKTKLFSLEDNYYKRLSELEHRESSENRLNDKVKDLVGLQSEVITFNIGGEKINVSKGLVESCIYDNIFKDVIDNILDIGRSLNDIENVFIDRNSKSFYSIIEIMRKAKLVNSGQEAKVILPKGINYEAFIQDVHFYFKQDAEKVLEDILLAYQGTNGLVYLNQSASIVESVKVSTNLPNDNLDPYRASTYQDIRKKNSNKAFFVSYDSEFVVTLTNCTILNSLEVKPFTFDLDSWYPGEGAGTFIFTSLDNVEWDFLATIPEDYGTDHEAVYNVHFEQRYAKYIKFQTGDFTLSISHLKIV
jgi:hypothetical protein